MRPADYCRNCNGTMKILKGFNPVLPCPRCKDTFGWEPEAWAAERKRNEEAEKNRNKVNPKP